ncbi:MAG: hypothetical protein IT246_06440 [Bacteroidia bacterium]|nr:hypothetical protein [Bacteroidia bacterium]MCZ2140774.1 hypothetical protein [Bacteroidia bacterium]
MKISGKIILAGMIMLVYSCSTSVSISDYYQNNTIDKNNTNKTSVSKSIMLYKNSSSSSNSTLEMIAYKSDETKYLIIGSRKTAKELKNNEQSYQVGINEIYPKMKEEEEIRAYSDYSVYYTNLSADVAIALADSLPAIKSAYTTLTPGYGQTMYLNYNVSKDLRISIPKKSPTERPSKCILWVGGRKHTMSIDYLTTTLEKFRHFN